MRLISFNEAVEKLEREEKLKMWAKKILSSEENSEAIDRKQKMHDKDKVFVDEVIYSKGKIYAKNEKALPNNLSMNSYFICGLKLSDTIYDGKNTSILFLDLNDKPIFNSMTNAFTYPLIGKESYDSFMKEMKATDLEELINRRVVVYSSDKCTKGISTIKYLM